VRTLLPLAVRSLWSRRVTAALTVLAIAVSVALLLGVQKLRSGARDSFASTISGTDLIVGARSGPLNLLLYSVFHLGDATAAVSWDSFELVRRHPDVAWALPVSLGDSHRGFRVMGTSRDYFAQFRYGRRQALGFEAGGPFEDLHDAVIGAGVAAALRYRIGDSILIAHGLGEVSFARHDEHPFRVKGILEPTGTPVDRLVIVSVEAIGAIHEGWESGMHVPRDHPRSEARGPGTAEPASITAFLVGMKSPAAVLRMQRALNEYRGEPLTAILPGVALAQLWQLVGVADSALVAVAACVVLAGLVGMVATLLTSLNERRREMAILRSVGAHPGEVFGLLVMESAFLATCGVLAGFLLTSVSLAAAAPLLGRHFGLYVAVARPGAYDFAIGAAVIAAGVLAGAIPAWRAYRNSLADGLSIRI
jgi:putative ABC transport system permease protein